MAHSEPKLLLFGHDTVECSYYLQAAPGCSIDFEALTVQREALRQAKSRDPKPITLGGVDFLLHRSGSSRGFDRWARKQNLSTRVLCKAVREMEAGLYEADLGDGLLKNTSVSMVQKWEIGQKRTTGTALKLLHLVQERGLEIVA